MIRKKEIIYCIDIGGTYFRYAQVNSFNKIISFESENIFDQKNQEKKLEKKLYDKIMLDIQSIKNLDGLVFAVPWLVDENKTNTKTYVTNFSENFSLKKIISTLEARAVPVYQINDVKAATLGEKHFGELQNYKNGLYINIGTGLSMGLIIENKLYTGTNGLAGEIAYSLSNPDDIKNSKKEEPLLENIISGRALNQLKNTVQNKTYLDKAINILSLHIINYCYILNPQIILLSGGVITNTKNIVEKIINIVNKKVSKENIPIIKMSETEKAGILGATYYYRNKRRLI